MWEYAVHADYEHIREYADGDENLIHIYMYFLICCILVQNLVIRIRLRMILGSNNGKLKRCSSRPLFFARLLGKVLVVSLHI